MPTQLRRGYSLGPAYERLAGVHGAPMRLKMDVMKTVFFLGRMPLGGDFLSEGTGFFFGHANFPYIVTAKHVAEAFGNDPVHIRLNRTDGTSAVMFYDPMQSNLPRMKWFFHPDDAVDIAVMPALLDLPRHDVDFLIINGAETVDRSKSKSMIGCGDTCYAVGLFSLAPGRAQNFPVIHTGTVARMSSKEELIPQWQVVGGGTKMIEGYLVQMTNLAGLSGAPVFVRQAVSVKISNGDYGMIPVERVDLMGVWSGSWEGPQAGNPHMRVPVGMGIVAPSERLVELLDSEPVKANRAEWFAKTEASVPDAAPPPKDDQPVR